MENADKACGKCRQHIYMHVVLEGLTVNCSICICLLCYKDKFGRTYIHANCMEGKQLILHIFMYNVMNDFSGAS